MDPLRAALLAGLLPGAIALAGLVAASLLSPRGDDPRSDEPGARAPWPARLLGALGPAIGVALSFILLQEQIRPGSVGLWPTVAINRAATLSALCALASVVVGLWPRSRLMPPLVLACAGALCAWGLAAPIKRQPAELALWIAGAAAWGAIIGGLWHAIAWRNLDDRHDPAPLVASALVPLGAAPVFFFGGGSVLPQPAMSLATVVGAGLVVILAFGARRAAPACGSLAALVASVALLLALAMLLGYRPSLPAVGLLMAAPLGLIPARLLRPRRALARWALAMAPVAILVASAAIVAWQMAPKDSGYGY